MSHLHDACPTLFDSVLARSDKRDMVAKEEMSFEMDISGSADGNH
jgi:hypothetical protein